MPANKPIVARFFLCTGQCVKYDELYKYPQSHIIGHLCFVSDEGKEVTALARWEVSVSCANVPPLQPVIDVFLVGDARRIKCRHADCQNTQRWEIGKAAFLALMRRYGKSTVEEMQA